jgi:hypothetical protein
VLPQSGVGRGAYRIPVETGLFIPSRKLAPLWLLVYPSAIEVADSAGATSSEDRSSESFKMSSYGGSLLTCQGKLPICKLQKTSQFAILLFKSLDSEPQRRHYVLPRHALSIP